MDYVNDIHSGWENNDGGEGTVTLTLDEDGLSVHLDHSDFYIEVARDELDL